MSGPLSSPERVIQWLCYQLDQKWAALRRELIKATDALNNLMNAIAAAIIVGPHFMLLPLVYVYTQTAIPLKLTILAIKNEMDDVVDAKKALNCPVLA
jgi:hypothetical protein